MGSPSRLRESRSNRAFNDVSVGQSTTDTEVLLSLCRRKLAPKAAPDVNIEHNHWVTLLPEAINHGLVELLQEAASGAASISTPTLALIQRAYLAQVARNFQLIDVLVNILCRFSASNIPALVLKGPAVALVAYDCVTKREITDLDLVVRPEDLQRAGVILSELGFRCLREKPDKLGSEKDVPFLRDIDMVLVELHWALNAPARRYPIEATGIWTRAQTIHFNEYPMKTLGLEDTFLSLSIHGSVHGWASLKWLFDIAQILNKKDSSLDWNVLLQRSTAAGCRRNLFVSVKLAATVLGARIPSALATEISNDNIARAIAEHFETSLINNEQLSKADLILCQVVMHDRLWDRFVVAYKYLPLPDCPESTTPLRLFIRAARLLRLYGYELLNAVFRGRLMPTYIS